MPQVKRREIWLANLSPTVGGEQSGLRPVVVASSDYFNEESAQLVYAIPITLKDKHIRSHVAVWPPEGGLTVPSFIMCEAMRSISIDRLIKRLGSVSNKTMLKIEDLLRILLDM